MAEVIGFTLAVLPLLISAADHYEDILQPFICFRNFSSKVDRFLQNLRIQRTIFRNECRILLESVVEHDVALLDKQLLEQLDRSKDACITIITQIEDQLRDVEMDSQDFAAIVLQSEQAGSTGDKAWRSRIGKKLKFAFSRSKLDSTLADLKALNDDFRVLSSQTSRLALPTQPVPQKSPTANEDVRKFRLIQKASLKVYEALGRSCTKHTEHLTHFCLDAVALENGDTPQVQFKLAFTHLTLQGSASSGDPVWFLIESITGNSSDKHAELGTDTFSLVQTLKRSGDAPQGQSCKKPKKSVRFLSTAAPSIPLQMPTATTDEPLRNLCMRKNFCDQLRNCFQQSPQAHRCVGTLDDTDCYKHLIYFPPPTVSHGQWPATSLEDVISTLSKQDPLGRLSQYDRFHLAHSLATAVLQYHATPWLKGSWRSEDIYFFGFDEQRCIEHPPDLSPPHLNVSVKGPDGVLSRASTFPPPRAFAPNPLLFGLGVLLLEIGYTATLESLKRPSDTGDGESRYTEFFTAKRLASSISREMGTAYGKIVNKCLHCDFGYGQDLDDPELQAGFHRDVVQELKKLENEFGGLVLTG